MNAEEGEVRVCVWRAGRDATQLSGNAVDDRKSAFFSLFFVLYHVHSIVKAALLESVPVRIISNETLRSSGQHEAISPSPAIGFSI